jgi:putative inorganic carbon (HCO3(-)) transporter
VSTVALRPVRLPDSASLFAGLIGTALLGLMIVQEPLLGFAAVFGVAMAVAILAVPDLATFAVVFLIYTNAAAVAVKYHDLPYTAGILIPGLVVVPVAFYLFRRRPVVADAATLAIFVFLFVQLVSTLMSENKGHALGEMTAFVVEGVAIYVLIRNAVRTVQILRLVVWTLLLAGVLMAAVVIFQEVTASYSKPFMGFGQVGREWFIGQAKTPRLSGPIGDPNYFAQILLVLVPLGLLRFFGERTMFLRLLAAGATGVIAFALTLTFSRGAGVAFVVVLVMMTVFRYIRPYQLLIVVLGLVMLLAFVPAYKERVATLGTLVTGSSSASSNQSLRSRSTEMKAAANVFLDHPFVGVGPGSFPLYYQEYARKVGLDVHEAAQSGARRGEEARRESHNIFLSIAADLGILGVLSFLAVIYLTFRRLNRSRKGWLRSHPEAANLAASFMLALAAYLTSGLFLTLAFERYFWLILALAGSAAALDLRDEEAAEPVREREAVRPFRRAPVVRDRPAPPVRRPRRRRVARPVERPHEVTIELPPPEQAEVIEIELPPPAEPVPVPVSVPIPVPVPVSAPETLPAPALVPTTVVLDISCDEAETGVRKLAEVPHVETCSTCLGTGAVGEDTCVWCEGIGRLVSWTTIEVEVPVGVKDGQRVALASEGTDLGYALLCVESDPNDRIIRFVAWAELLGALAFFSYHYLIG